MMLSIQPPPFTVTPINLESAGVADIGEDGDVRPTRPLSDVVRPSLGCITEEENRERLGTSLEMDLPSVAALKGKYTGQKLIVCGGGASLERTLADIRRARRLSRRVKILAVNKTHDWLIEKGIVPDFGVMMDPRVHLVDYMTPRSGVTYLFGASSSRVSRLSYLYRQGTQGARVHPEERIVRPVARIQGNGRVSSDPNGADDTSTWLKKTLRAIHRRRSRGRGPQAHCAQAEARRPSRREKLYAEVSASRLTRSYNEESSTMANSILSDARSKAWNVEKDALSEILSHT